MPQHTTARPVRVAGIGLHSGQQAQLRILPAPADHGLLFIRTDLPGSPSVPARCAWVSDTTLATTLVRGPARVATVEHLLAALYAAEIDNARLELEGPEIPILDGSAKPWSEALVEAGKETQEVRAPRIFVRRRIAVESGERRLLIEPCDTLEITVHVDFAHPCIGQQSLSFALDPTVFQQELAWARTFGFLPQVEGLRAAGLVQGGSLANAVVYDDTGVLNAEGLRAEDEVVRHKALDLVGDLALLGARLSGRIQATRPGHGMTVALLRALRADAGAYSLE